MPIVIERFCQSSRSDDPHFCNQEGKPLYGDKCLYDEVDRLIVGRIWARAPWFPTFVVRRDRIYLAQSLLLPGGVRPFRVTFLASLSLSGEGNVEQVMSMVFRGIQSVTWTLERDDLFFDQRFTATPTPAPEVATLLEQWNAALQSLSQGYIDWAVQADRSVLHPDMVTLRAIAELLTRHAIDGEEPFVLVAMQPSIIQSWGRRDPLLGLLNLIAQQVTGMMTLSAMKPGCERLSHFNVQIH